MTDRSTVQENTGHPVMDERQFKILIERAPIAIGVSHGMSIIYMNARFLEMFGFDRFDELYGHPLLEQVAPQCREEFERWLRLLDQHQAVSDEFETIGLRRDGSQFPFYVAVNRIEWDGRPGYVGAVIDISERKQIEVKLRSSEKKYRQLYDNLMDAFASTDMDGGIREFNQAYADMLGYTPDELRRLTYIDVTPEKWHRMEADIIARQVIPRGYSDIYEKEYRRKDGSVFPVELRAVLIRDDKGKPVGLWSIVRNISKRKHDEAALRSSEQRLRNIIDEAPFGAHLYELHKDGLLVFIGANRAADRILKVDHQKFIGKTIEESFPDLIKTEIPDAYRHVAATGERYEREQVEYDAQGIVGAFDIRAFQTGPNRMAVFFYDITERKRAEEALRSSEKKYRHLYDSMMDGFVHVDIEGRIREFNRAYVDMLGYSPNELRRLTYIDITPEKWHKTEADLIAKQVMTRGYSDVYEKEYCRKDGTVFPVELRAVLTRDDKGKPNGLWGIVRDISKRKQIENELRKGHELSARVMETSPVGIVSLDAKGEVVFANHLATKLLGYSKRDIAGLPYNSPAWRITTLDGSPFPEQDLPFARIKQTKKPIKDVQHAIQYPDGRRILLSVNGAPLFTATGEFDGIVATIEDITERKRAEEALRESETRLRKAQAVGHIGSWEYTIKTGMIWGSDEAFRIYGLTPPATHELPAKEIETYISDREKVHQALTDLIEKKSPYELEFTVEPAGGKQSRIITSMAELVSDENGNPVKVVGVIQDITERKRDEEALRKSEATLQSIFRSSPSGVGLLSYPDRRIMYVNERFCEMTGFSRDEVIGKNSRFLYPGKAEYDHVGNTLYPAIQKTGISILETCWRRKNGTTFDVQLSSAPIDPDDITQGISIVIQDVTERKRSEVALKESERRFRTLVTNLTGMVYRSKNDEHWTMEFVSDGSIALTGYAPSALVNNAQIAYADLILSEDRTEVWETVQRALTDRAPFCMEYRIRASQGEIRWVQELGRGVYDDRGNVIALEGFISDITERKHAEEELENSYDKLQRSLEGTINAITAIVETRDPYTAGHQQRVSLLAAAIAREMGFSADRVNSIRIGASLHDVGKIYVPAEILSKPGALSIFEWAIVKVYPQAGYDILKRIEFAGPVAQIALQHQERLNGSGYPRGLSGNDISIEAKIVAVADVVEAMSFYRPYRGPIGMEKAVEEIMQYRGVLYAPDVVDACVRLIRDKKFSFETPAEKQEPVPAK